MSDASRSEAVDGAADSATDLRAEQASAVVLDEPEVYAVTLAPHRSLTQRGFLIVMVSIGLVSFVSGLAFLAVGAWPIFGFFGLDVLIIYFAFRANFRSAGAREYIRVTPSVVEVRRVPVKGRARTIRLNPFWTRIWREDDEDHGTLDVALVSGRETVPVGRFLGPEQKGALADDLSAALRAVKRGVTRSTF
ncbi:DUF2244 domain-containing protein [Xanthobacter pseudotagetidis]|uniref:DUF2244 domain-containing protein n=1 Tax=Xanthobacter pseudotagetidis TaxID=3119911 RepID=UPI003726A0DB